MSGSNRSERAKPYQERTVRQANPRQPEIVTRDAFVSPKKGPAEQLRIVAEIVVNYRAYIVVRGAAFSDGSRLRPGGLTIRNLRLTEDQGGTYEDCRSHRFMHVADGLYAGVRQVTHIENNNRGERENLGEIRDNTMVWLIQAVCTLHQEDDEGVGEFVANCVAYTEGQSRVKNPKKRTARGRVAQAGQITRTKTGKVWNTPMKAPLVWSSEHLLGYRQEDLDKIKLKMHPLGLKLAAYLGVIRTMFTDCETYLDGVIKDASLFALGADANVKRLKEAGRLRNGAKELRVINAKPFVRACRRTAADMLAAAELLEFAVLAAEGQDTRREQDELAQARARLDRGRRSMLLGRLYHHRLEQNLFVVSKLKHMKRVPSDPDRDRLVAQLSADRDHLRDDHLDDGFARPFLQRVVEHLNAAITALQQPVPDIETAYVKLKAACEPF